MKTTSKQISSKKRLLLKQSAELIFKSFVLIVGRISGETKSGQTSRQLYNNPEEFPMLERTPPLPEDEAVCHPHSGLGTRVSCQKVCISLSCKNRKETFRVQAPEFYKSIRC